MSLLPWITRALGAGVLAGSLQASPVAGPSSSGLRPAASSLPPIDASKPVATETATFALG